MAIRKTKAEAEPERKPAKSALAEAPVKGGSRGLAFQLQVGLISLPVKLYTGARPESVRFHRLHSTCRGQVKNSVESGGAYCPHCEEHLKSEEVVRGYEVNKGEYVILSEEEIASCKPDTDKLIAIESFVPAADIDPIYFETSYYLNPQEGGARAYVLIRDMLSTAQRMGIGKATLYGNEHTVLLRPFGKGLALHHCFHNTELNMIDFGVGDAEVTHQELKLAQTLMDQMAGRFEPGRYFDRYMANVQELVAAKQDGTARSPVVMQKRAPVIDLMSALAQSVEIAKQRRSA
jgi:DNA end-binding protein Ku